MDFLTSNVVGVPLAATLIVIGIIVARIAEVRQFKRITRWGLIVISLLIIFAAAFWLGLLVAYNTFNPLTSH